MENYYYRTERCYRTYEPAITAACAAYPKAICYCPAGRCNATTDAARCRDAITRWCDEQWETTPDVILVKMRDITVWIEDRSGEELVFIGPKKLRKVRRLTHSLLDRWKEPATQNAGEVQRVELHPSSRTPKPIDIYSFNVATQVAKLNAGEYVGQITHPFTEELHAEITTLLADKLNVGMVVKGGNIIIF